MTHFIVVGIVTSTATNPIWVIKTRLQLQGANGLRKYSGSVDCLLKIIRQEGVGGLYKGMSASYLGTVSNKRAHSGEHVLTTWMI